MKVPQIKPRRTVEGMGGIKVEVVTREEVEAKESIAVCMPTGPDHFGDNLTGACSWCGRQIMFRPKLEWHPKKVCLPCVAKRIALEVINGGEVPKMTTLDSSAEEFENAAKR